MGQREFIVLIIIAVVILLVVLDIFSRLKVRKQFVVIGKNSLSTEI